MPLEFLNQQMIWRNQAYRGHQLQLIKARAAAARFFFEQSGVANWIVAKGRS